MAYKLNCIPGINPIHLKVSMIRNYFISALRYLLRYRSITIFNILGLSIGIAVSVVIFLYVRFETTYDDYHPEADRVFRVEKISNIYNEIEKIASIPVFVSDALEGFEEVEHMGRIGPWRSNVVRYGESAFKEDGLFSANPGYFQIMGIEVLEGDPVSGMNRPFTAVLTETMSRKYFGDESPMGEIIVIDTSRFEVVATIKDFPRNTHEHHILGKLFIDPDGVPRRGEAGETSAHLYQAPALG